VALLVVVCTAVTKVEDGDVLLCEDDIVVLPEETDGVPGSDVVSVLSIVLLLYVCEPVVSPIVLVLPWFVGSENWFLSCKKLRQAVKYNAKAIAARQNNIFFIPPLPFIWLLFWPS
jgi:hypothetical protein